MRQQDLIAYAISLADTGLFDGGRAIELALALIEPKVRARFDGDILDCLDRRCRRARANRRQNAIYGA